MFVASARVWGKRHLYLLGTLIIIISSAWGGASGTNYKSLVWARVFQGVGLAPFEALVNASVGDLYFVHVSWRNKKQEITSFALGSTNALQGTGKTHGAYEPLCIWRRILHPCTSRKNYTHNRLAMVLLSSRHLLWCFVPTHSPFCPRNRLPTRQGSKHRSDRRRLRPTRTPTTLQLRAADSQYLCRNSKDAQYEWSKFLR